MTTEQLEEIAGELAAADGDAPTTGDTTTETEGSEAAPATTEAPAGETAPAPETAAEPIETPAAPVETQAPFQLPQPEYQQPSVTDETNQRQQEYIRSLEQRNKELEPIGEQQRQAQATESAVQYYIGRGVDEFTAREFARDLTTAQHQSNEAIRSQQAQTALEANKRRYAQDAGAYYGVHPDTLMLFNTEASMKAFGSTVQTFQKENIDLKKENADFKKRLERLEKRSVPESPLDGGVGGAGGGGTQFTREQLGEMTVDQYNEVRDHIVK